jgi:long-chain fatty acid transport protein
VCVLALYSVTNAYGSGFAIFTQNATALGQGNAVTAHADDPSAVFYNPALINNLEGTQIGAGTTLLIPNREFGSSGTGDASEAKRSAYFPSTLFVSHKVSESFSAGIGVFSPFGLGTEWDKDWDGRYITTRSELMSVNVNPVVSFRIHPRISLAAGLDYVYLDAELEKMVNLSALGLPDATQLFKGDGEGYGFNLGALVVLHEDVSAGLSYRSEVDVDIDGNADFSFSPGTPSAVRAIFPDTGGSTELSLPQQLTFGVQYRGFYPLTFETGLRWEGWSSFNELRISLEEPVAGQSVSISEREWEDAYAANVGVQYHFNEEMSFLAGYLYGESPVPDGTFEPSIPDSDAHVFSLGATVKKKWLKASLAYAYQLFEERVKDNSIDDNPSDGVVDSVLSANGEYESDIHIIALSITFLF